MPSVLQLTSDLPVEGGKRRDEFVFLHDDKESRMQPLAEKRRKKAKTWRLIDGVLNERTDARMQIGSF